MTEPATAPLRLVVVMPVFNDWDAAGKLCALLDAQFQSLPEVSPEILVVDDGSSEPSGAWERGFSALWRVSILRLRRNLGHQRAIAVALAYVHANIPADAVAVMDADGEDRPEDVPRLLAKLRETRGSAAVFAERGRRVEGLVFRLGYLAYRVLHRALTGIPVRIGNFSVLPATRLDTVVALGELWNHYAAAIVKSRLPYVTLRTDRGRRLAGRSRMNLVALVFHGLSALVTFAEIIITRVLFGSLMLTGLLVLGLVLVAGARLGTEFAVPGWATILAGLFAVMAIQLAVTVTGLAFYALGLHANTAFLPIRDHAFFVQTLETVYGPRHER